MYARRTRVNTLLLLVLLLIFYYGGLSQELRRGERNLLFLPLHA